MKMKSITALILTLLITIALCPAMASADDDLTSFINVSEQTEEFAAMRGLCPPSPWETIRVPACDQEGLEQRTNEYLCVDGRRN